MVGKHCMCWHDFRVFIMLSNTLTATFLVSLAITLHFLHFQASKLKLLVVVGGQGSPYKECFLFTCPVKCFMHSCLLAGSKTYQCI